MRPTQFAAIRKSILIALATAEVCGLIHFYQRPQFLVFAVLSLEGILFLVPVLWFDRLRLQLKASTTGEIFIPPVVGGLVMWGSFYVIRHGGIRMWSNPSRAEQNVWNVFSVICGAILVGVFWVCDLLDRRYRRAAKVAFVGLQFMAFGAYAVQDHASHWTSALLLFSGLCGFVAAARYFRQDQALMSVPSHQGT